VTAAVELVDGCWQLPCRGVNVYLLERDALVLVDAGTPFDAGRIRAGVASTGHRLADVDHVLVTHFDLDHVGGLARLDDALAAPVHMPEPDASYLTRTASPGWDRKGAFQRLARPLVRRPALNVVPIEDGDVVAGLTAVHTPGHTCGHTAYVDGTVGFLGDLVVEADGALARPPALMTHDMATDEASIRALAARGPDFAVAAMGHGEPLVAGGHAALVALAERLS